MKKVKILPIYLIPFFFIRVTTNTGLASIRAWMSVMDLEIWYKFSNFNLYNFCHDGQPLLFPWIARR
ncbi:MULTISPECIES: hypothetical protein [Microcystis]|jgi:hypothetical protein|uniref:Uncharacterized protein n=1 Tax=Microcystis aeruginosa (strain NIES-843 / IAM M-2473) TaxID=449447 RepID=B0JS60_MICAN|nr:MULTISPECIES: hypothetical protein [Microcystis]BAG04018.1 unknown protein [Microcystis aeruginosa NIES-843]